jgi:hypothetical protein
MIRTPRVPGYFGFIGIGNCRAGSALSTLWRIREKREGFRILWMCASFGSSKKNKGQALVRLPPLEARRLVIAGSENDPCGDTRVVLGIALEMRGEILGLNQTNGHVLPDIPVQSAPKCPGKRIIRRAL